METIIGIVRVTAWTLIGPWSVLLILYALELLALAFNRKQPAYTFYRKEKATVHVVQHLFIFLIEGLLLGVLLHM